MVRDGGVCLWKKVGSSWSASPYLLLLFISSMVPLVLLHDHHGLLGSFLLLLSITIASIGLLLIISHGVLRG